MDDLAMHMAPPPTGVLLGAVALLAVIVGLRFSTLSASRGQKIGAWLGMAFGAGIATAMAIIKHNSASHALIIFADVMAGLLVALAGQSGDLRDVFKRRAEGDTNAVISDKTTRRMLIAFCGAGVILLGAEYAVFWT